MNMWWSVSAPDWDCRDAGAVPVQPITGQPFGSAGGPRMADMHELM